MNTMQLIPPLTTDPPKLCSEILENNDDEREQSFNSSFRLN